MCRASELGAVPGGDEGGLAYCCCWLCSLRTCACKMLVIKLKARTDGQIDVGAIYHVLLHTVLKY